jgi:hypothetical protein
MQPKRREKEDNTVVRMQFVVIRSMARTIRDESLSTSGAVVVVVQLAVAGKRRVRYSCWIRPAMR